MPPSEPLLHVTGLRAGYGPVRVLHDVALHVADGELVAVCGPNGVGKTTLIRALSGLLPADAGMIAFDGGDITGAPCTRRVRAGISTVVGQQTFGSLTVADNLRVQAYAATRRRTERDGIVDATLAVFPRLDERRDQPASTLSGGERQMLALAKTLVQQPRLVLIDEFSLGLAPVVVAGLMELVRRLNRRGTAFLIVEQSVNVALSLVHRAYFMEKGEIVAEHDAAGLAARPDLVRSLMLGGHAQVQR